MIPRILFEMRALILKKMARLFEIEDIFPVITQLADITTEISTLEKMMKNTWEMVVLELESEDAKQTWGDMKAAKEIFDLFDLFDVVEGVKEELGTQVNDEFYEKALKITERLYTQRIEEIKDHIGRGDLQ